MADNEAKTETKKKGGKLPIIIVLALVLGGGGFFAMKMKSGGAKKEPELALGKVQELDEFLVNLAGGSSYLRARIALQMEAKVPAEHSAESLPAIRDAIIMTLTSKSLRQLESLEGKKALKREIATAVNHVLEHEEAKDGEKKGEAKDGEESGKDAKAQAKEGDSSAKHPDWDSETGPVLKVFLTDFATQ